MTKIQLGDITNAKNVLRREVNGLDDMVASIKEHGVIVPVKVRRVDGKYELVYGHRRAIAAKKAGLKEIEATVEGLDDTEALLQSVIENVQREDLSDMEEGEAFKAIKELTGWTNTKIGEAVGKSEPYISERIALINSKPIIAEFVSRKTNVPDAAWKARYLRTLPPAVQGAVAKKVATEELTSRQTEALVTEVKRQQSYAGNKGVKAVLRVPYEELGLQGPTEAKRDAKAKKPETSTWEYIPIWIKGIRSWLKLMRVKGERGNLKRYEALEDMLVDLLKYVREVIKEAKGD
jgi:ParB family chromosome partitioning protein